MTVSTTTNRASYSGNGSTTAFAYGFKIFADADLTVIIRSSAGVETTKTLSTHYTVSGAGNASGGNVTFTSGNVPASGETVVILRQLTLTQGTDYVANDPFPAESHEDALDRLTMVTQQLDEEIGRTLKVSQTNVISSPEFTADATARANKLLSFDASGNLIATQEIGVFKGDSATTTTSAFTVRDIVKATTTAQLNNIYICVADSVVGDALTDTDHFALIVDAVAAASSATAAASSATAAASSASTASTQASNASSSASTSSTQATNSANSATASASSATAAAASAASAAASLDAFDDNYLGAKSSDPSTDNDGDALNAGDLYFNTSSNVLKVYNGSAWQEATLVTTATTAELNIMDGDTSASSTTVADADRVVFNDAGTMKQVAVTDLAAYFDDEITAMPNLVTTGALNSGSITSGFGTIDTGSSAITTTGVITGGTLEATADTSAGDNAAIGFTSAEGLILTGQGSTSDITFKNDADTTVFSIPTGTDDISFPDNAAILMGAGNDLKIFHNGSNSQINDLSTGNLQLLSNGAGVDVLKTDGEVMAKFITDGAVELYHNAVKKLETSASGVDITGALATSGQVQIGAYSPASDAILSAVDSGNGLEWGHANASGYRSTLGAFSGGGAPFIALSAEAGTNANTFRTRGIAGSVITTDNAGALVVQQVTTASADNQSGTERMRLDSSGNLLVGTTTNDIYDSTSEVGSQISDGYLAVARASTVAYFNRLSSDGEVVMFRKGGTTVGSISTYSGDLAIGTNNVGLRFIDSTDANALRIVPSNIGSSTDVDASLDLGMSSARFKDGYFSGTVFCVQIRGVSDTNTGIDVTGSDIIAFKTGGSQRAEFSTGALRIGQSTTDHPGSGNTTTGIGLRTNGDAFFSDADSDAIYGNRNNAGGVVSIALSGTAKGGISVSSSAVAFNTTSDRRLKSNIEDAASASDKIDAIQVRQFDWNADNSHQDYGLIAQELVAIEPMAVSGDENSDEMMSVDYSKLVPMLIKEIQELRSRVATLEAS